MIEQQKIIEAIAEHLGLSAPDIDRNSLLREDLNLGPLELSDLLSDLSDKFGVEFEPEDISNIKKVDDLVILIEDSLIT